MAPIFGSRCAPCHFGPGAAAGWRATSFLEAIGCFVDPAGAERPATLPSDSTAPILGALRSSAHTNVVTGEELAILERWIRAGAPAFPPGVHPPGIVDPRSPDFHGTRLRSERWAPMLDPGRPDACGRCHDGAPARPADVAFAAPGAISCTTCHDRPGGVLACTTCHGEGEAHGTRAYPPRDPCFFGAETRAAGAHAAHVAGPRSPLACSTCHPAAGVDIDGDTGATPAPAAANLLSGTHGNGSVDVRFDPAVVAKGGSYDPATGGCTVSCHDRGGAHPRPLWTDDTQPSCGNCHGSPPAQHYPGACTACHREANADGTALAGGPLHLNGRVDLGDGSGACGACHGRGDDAWPSTNAHPSHEHPSLASAVECTSCHPSRASVHDPGHLDGVVQIVFTGAAAARNATPVYERGAGTPKEGTCAGVACHGASLADAPAVVPRWGDASGAARSCGACHPLPPTQHTESTSCERAECHGGEVARTTDGFQITDSGRAPHIDGVVDQNRNP